MPELRLALSSLDREQAFDLRRSVLCGELNWPRESVNDGLDAQSRLALAWEGPKPVGTGRLRSNQGAWELELLAVLPAFRGRGLGRGLVELLGAEARSLGALSLRAWAPRERAPFFQACLFLPQREDRGWALFEKPLAGSPSGAFPDL